MTADIASSPEFVDWRGNPSSELQRDIGQRETGASVVRWFDPALVPGLLQTRDYAQAVVEVCVHDKDDLQPALEQRMTRQQRWRISYTQTHFVLGEQALYTVVGNADTTRTQLEMLLRPLPATVTLGIVPRSARFHIAPTNFIIYDGKQVDVETATGGLHFTDRANVGDYLTVFDTLVEHAVQGIAAHALIGHAISTFR